MAEMDLTDLPEEVVAAIKAPAQLAAEQLESLGKTLAEKRDESVKARTESGIEGVWLAAEEAYLGIDDANRHEYAGVKWAKPMGITGPVVSDGPPRGSVVRSTVFVRLTSRYVDAAAAKVGEILLPIDDKPFSFDATPVPDLIGRLHDKTQVINNGVPLERPARPGEATGQPGAAQDPTGGPAAALPAAPTQAVPGSPMVPLTVGDLAEEQIQLAQKKAKKAEKRIHDWMVESQYSAEMRKVIFDAARIGVGVLHGPFPKKRRTIARTKADDGTMKIEVKYEVVPAYEWRDPWNIFPDRACGEDIHHGNGIFELDHFSSKQLRDLKDAPGYINSAIDKVLREGPQKESQNHGNPSANDIERNKHRFAVWHYTGMISRKDLLAAGSIEETEKTPDEVYAITTLVNDTVIRAVLSPLESGDLNYHAVPWQRRAGHWAGVGVGEQVSMPQRLINGATRSMSDNAGKSSGSITVLDRGSITPADGGWELTPDKLFYKSDDAVIDDVRKAFAFFQIPNTTPQLLSIIEYALRLAEESTSIPLVSQGQSGPTTPETFGATQLQNNNANQLLRSIGYAFDDYITEPVVRQSYEMLLLDDSVPEDEKGDWSINAHGSTAFVERAIQDQTIQAMGAFVKDPAFGTNPKKWFAEFMRTKHLNPTVFQYTPEEQAKIDSQPPPAPPAVEVAKIKSADTKAKIDADAAQAAANAALEERLVHLEAEAKAQIQDMKDEVERLRIKRDTDRDTIYVQAETQRTEAESNARMSELALRRELALLEYANQHQISVNEVKASLAETAMKLRVEKELVAANNAAKGASAGTANAVELPGRAAPGKAAVQ